MADPRAFISFDFDNNLTGQESVRRADQELKNSVLC